jgi:hypothetical protein
MQRGRSVPLRGGAFKRSLWVVCPSGERQNPGSFAGSRKLAAGSCFTKTKPIFSRPNMRYQIKIKETEAKKLGKKTKQTQLWITFLVRCTPYAERYELPRSETVGVALMDMWLTLTLCFLCGYVGRRLLLDSLAA